jgi:phosphatidylglycerol:prolipoprotein diacylglycerol transferase
LAVSWYAISVVVGVWIATEVAARLATRRGQRSEDAWRGLVWVAICGLIGARLWFVLFPPQSFADNGITSGWMLTHIFEVNQGPLAIWTGGFGLIGAIIGGGIGLLLFTRKNHIPFVLWLDIAAVALPLAQAVVRLGEGATQSLYGPPTNLPWGMLISDEAQRVGPYTDLARYPLQTTRFQPAYLYECLLALAIFAVLLVLFTRYEERLRSGDIALLYVVTYGVGRFLLEFSRINVSLMGNVNVSQVVGGAAALIAAGTLFRRYRQRSLKEQQG